MHESSMTAMAGFVDSYLGARRGRPLAVLDVGSMNVNGSYRQLFDDPAWSYTGVDLQPGPGVDHVLESPYEWGLPAAGYDVVISGQAFEHIEFPWLTIREVARVLRPGGITCIIAPSGGPEHRYPVDCWRFYPDGMGALARWAGLQVQSVTANWEPDREYVDDSAQWGDTVLIATRPAGGAAPAAVPHSAPAAPPAPGSGGHLPARARPRPGPSLRRVAARLPAPWRARLVSEVDRFVCARFDELARRLTVPPDPAAAPGPGMDGAAWRYPRAAAVLVDGFRGLYDRPVDDIPPPAPVRDAIVEQFTKLYFHSRSTTWESTRYLGTDVWKCPLDLWIYQEIVYELRPDLIVETGTGPGGSARFLADLCERFGRGQVITIDIAERPGRPTHPRIRYLSGSSTDPSVVATVRAAVAPGDTVMVVLDSDHSAGHVRAELDAYADLVTPGSSLIVEDTCVNGHPVLPDFGPGPMEAVRDFLAAHPEFRHDASRERLLMTFQPHGYLTRIR